MLRAQGTGLRAQGSGHGAQGTGHRAQGSGLRKKDKRKRIRNFPSLRSREGVQGVSS